MQFLEGASLIAHSPGPCLIVVGGVHGNEPAGIRTIQILEKLTREHDWITQGSIYGLIGNPAAVAASVRFIDENLNRVFGRSEKKNTFEEKRADEISRWLEDIARTHPNMRVLDLHSVSMDDTKMVVFNANDPRALLWANTISTIPLRLGFTEETIPGSLIGYIEKIGGLGLSIECGNHSAETGATVGLEHIEKALEDLGILVQKKTTYMGKITHEGEKRAYRLTEKIVPKRGFVFTMPVVSESSLRKNVLFATSDTGEYRAPYDCYVMMPAKHPDPNDTDAGFLATKI